MDSKRNLIDFMLYSVSVFVNFKFCAFDTSIVTRFGKAIACTDHSGSGHELSHKILSQQISIHADNNRCGNSE